jgi:hypothetical protein
VIDSLYLYHADQDELPAEAPQSDCKRLGLILAPAIPDPLNSPDPLTRCLDQEALTAAQPVLPAVAGLAVIVLVVGQRHL